MASSTAPVKVAKEKKPTITLTLSEDVYGYIVGEAMRDRRTPAMWTTIYLEEGILGILEDQPEKGA